MRKLRRIEFHIIETYSEIEMTEEEFIELSNLPNDEDNDDYCYKMIDLFEGKYKINVPTSDRTELEPVEFKLPEQSQYLGHIDMVDDCIIENSIYDVKALHTNNITELDLLNNKTLKTFYWDYSSLDKYNDIKSYIRNHKINNILK